MREGGVTSGISLERYDAVLGGDCVWGAYPSLDQKGKIPLLISLHGGLYTKLDAPGTTYHSPVTTGYHLKQPSNLLIYDNLFAMFN